ncbi:MAG: exodeoxyribonuclease VII large subunit [Burkholderiaceae bacterium]
MPLKALKTREIMRYGEHSESRSNDGRAIPVSALNRAVSQLLGSSFPMLWVSGEVSNFTRAASGHCYFSLKDKNAQVRAVLFRSRAQAAPVSLRNGLQIEVLAAVSLYEPRGDFQITVENVRLAGTGDLHQQFVELKNRLQAEGLFDVDRKRVLPSMPRSIGVVTSLQAAALRDVLITLRRRAPHLQVVVYPTPVQGDDAPASIVRALAKASLRAECDVLLLVRGGGSIEDLWAFNAESVARAIRASNLPVIVGVGHESDVTIADFAADMRAPTPTGAATIVAPDSEELRRQISGLGRLLAQAWQRRHRELEQRIDTAWRLLPSPAGQLLARQARIHDAARNLVRQFAYLQQRREQRMQLARGRLRVPDIGVPASRIVFQEQRLTRALKRLLEARTQQLHTAAAQLRLVSPQAVLERGYSIVRDETGQVVSRAGRVAPGNTLDILMADGAVDAVVRQVHPPKSST